jgi:hypothetical protein
MMSAAVLASAGGEQVGTRSASSDLFSDQDKPEGISFAASFHERIEDSALLQGKSSASREVIALPSLKSAALAKRVDEVVDIPVGVKGKPLAAPEISAHDKLKSTVAEKIVQPQPQAQAVIGPQERITAGDSGPKEFGSSTQAEEVRADDVSTAPYTPPDVQVAGQTDEGPAPSVKIADDDPLLISNVGGPAVQKGTDTAAREKEVVSAKKSAKPQERAATPKTVKTIGMTVSATAVETRPAIGNSKETAIPAVGQAAATDIVSQTVMGKITAGSSEVVSSVDKPSTGVAPATADDSVRKETAHGAKVGVPDIETTRTTADEETALPMDGAGLENTTAVAVPVDNDGDGLTQSAPRAATAAVHAMSGGAGISQGIVFGAVISGDTPGDLIAANLQVGDVGRPIAGPPIEPREQDGHGPVEASMDGMPRMLTATPTAIEVGIPTGTHGWLKVRAEMADSGVINASVSAASSAGQEMLHRELPSLTAYLQQEKVAVNTVVVHTAATAGVESRSSGAGMSSGGGQTPEKGNEGGEQRHSVGAMVPGRPDKAMGYREVGDEGLSPPAVNAGGGNWLSVRA